MVHRSVFPIAFVASLLPVGTNAFEIRGSYDSRNAPRTPIEGLARIYFGRDLGYDISFAQSIYAGAKGDGGGAVLANLKLAGADASFLPDGANELILSADGAVSGGAGYAIRMLGLGWQQPISDRWVISLEGRVGAAGGGGVIVTGGVIGSVAVEAEYALNDAMNLSVGLGKIKVLKGGGMAPAR